eukprot:c23824_g2_i1 orf=542-745(+)
MEIAVLQRVSTCFFHVHHEEGRTYFKNLQSKRWCTSLNYLLQIPENHKDLQSLAFHWNGTPPYKRPN